MKIRKGPFGYFAIEKIGSRDDIYEYASEMIDLNHCGIYLPCYINDGPGGITACFDFSGFIPITEFDPHKQKSTAAFSRRNREHLRTRRKNTGLLLNSFARGIDNLLSPGSAVLDRNYVFTDPAGDVIRICYCPIRQPASQLSLFSLGYERLEELLADPFFDGVISEDEKQTLVYSVRQNDEAMYLECCQKIESEDPEDAASEAGQGRLVLSQEMILSVLPFIAAAASYLFIGPGPALLFAALGLVMAGRMIFAGYKKRKAISAERITERSDERSRILFSNTEYANETGIPCAAQLILKDSIPGIRTQYAIYMDKTTIGSDVFLSDIVLKHKSVASLHAVIYMSGNTFYISPCSTSGALYLEDKRLDEGMRYEIRDGQKITVGELDFCFRLLFPSIAQASASEHQIRTDL